MMLMEHVEGRGYVRAMADALDGWEKGLEASRAVVIENSRAYLRLLREHIQKEDEILFEMADNVLSAEEQKQLLHQFEEHEKEEIGPGVHEKYLKIAQELENDNP
jgi:hemerythrin-like domain-containing protein